MPTRASRPYVARLLSVAATISLTVLSCSKSPSPTTSSSSSSETIRLDLIAPAELAPGEAGKLTANAVKSDGHSEDVTSQAQWQIQSFTTGAVAAATGVISGVTPGRSVISAQ